jgi:hypothetical protein
MKSFVQMGPFNINCSYYCDPIASQLYDMNNNRPSECSKETGIGA